MIQMYVKKQSLAYVAKKQIADVLYIYRAIGHLRWLETGTGF